MNKNIKLSLTTLLVVLFAAMHGQANGLLEVSASLRTRVVAPTTTTIRTIIRDQVATTVHTFQYDLADTLPQRIRFGMRIGAGVTMTSLRYRVDSVWRLAVVERADSAAGGGTGGPVGGGTSGSALESAIGSQGFVLPFRDTLRGPRQVEVEVTGTEVLAFGSGRLSYALPLDLLSTRGVRQVQWSLDARTSFPLRDVQIEPSVAVTLLGDTGVQMSRTMVDCGTLRLSAGVSLTDMLLTVLSYKPENEDGFAVMLGVPATSDGTNVMPKRFTMVVDQSGSMSGLKMEQAKDAARYCVSRLRADDEVNILAFNSYMSPLYTAPRRADASVIQDCQSFIDRLQASSGTEITKALTTALGSYADTSFVNLVIFITDGIATIDYDAIQRANRMKARVFVVGIGSDVNESGLRRIASEHRALYTSIKHAGNVSDSIAALYRAIKDPLVKDPVVTVTPAVTYDMLPLNIPDIYAGERFLLGCRYKVGGDVAVRIDGTDVRGHTALDFTGHLVDGVGGDAFVPKLWAGMRVAALLELMSRESSTSTRYAEWRDEIIRLGITYGILTPYTSFKEGPQDDRGGTTDVREDVMSVQDAVQVMPNPAYGRTVVGMEVLSDLDGVTIDIIGMDGSVVRTIDVGHVGAGPWTYPIELTDAYGASLAPGVYIIVIRAGGVQRTARIVITEA